MADNYLEKQRELYDARKAAWEKKTKRNDVKKLIAQIRERNKNKTD